MALSPVINSLFPPEESKSVTILGGGPGGLMNAIISVLNGEKTTLIELRDEHAKGRENSVQLNEESIELLKKYGIYQRLEEKGHIYPPSIFKTISVRLTDLESAMKSVLEEISRKKPIKIIYKDKVDAIHVDQVSHKINLLLSSGELIPSVDILINAEGAKSSTNELLGNDRIVVLEKLPVIAATFVDERPEIVDIGSFFTYIGLSIAYTAMAIYHYAIFFFHFLFLGEMFTNPERSIGGSLILQTPRQNYVGAGLSKEKSDEMIALRDDMLAKRIALENGDTLNRDELEKQLELATHRYSDFINYWTHLSYCNANVLAFTARVIAFFTGSTPFVQYDVASWLPLKETKSIEIGADKTRLASCLMGKSLVLISGDARATPDPTTGMGCNAALLSSKLFQKVLADWNQKNIYSISQEYIDESDKIVDQMHWQSRIKREIYRPDAV